MRKGGIVPPEWQQPEIVTKYLQHLTERGLGEGTREVYAGVLNRLAVWLSVRGVSLTQATPEILGSWRTGMRCDRATIILYVTSAQLFYRWAHRHGHMTQDPAWAVPKPRAKPRLPRPVDEETLAAVLSVATGMIRVWIVLAAYCGLRAAEIAQLTWDDVRSGNGAPYLTAFGKGQKDRSVPLSPFVWAELLAWGRTKRGPIFRRADGRAFTPSHLDKIANTWLHETGFIETMHQFRHRFGTASALATHGDLVTVGGTMGHANINTTLGYTALASQVARAMVCAIQPPGWPGSSPEGSGVCPTCSRAMT